VAGGAGCEDGELGAWLVELGVKLESWVCGWSAVCVAG
jgi:hypothetical protein